MERLKLIVPWLTSPNLQDLRHLKIKFCRQILASQGDTERQRAYSRSTSLLQMRYSKDSCNSQRIKDTPWNMFPNSRSRRESSKMADRQIASRKPKRQKVSYSIFFWQLTARAGVSGWQCQQGKPFTILKLILGCVIRKASDGYVVPVFLSFNETCQRRKDLIVCRNIRPKHKSRGPKILSLMLTDFFH